VSKTILRRRRAPGILTEMRICDLSDRPRKKRPASNAGRRWEETGRKEHKRRAKRVRAQGRGIRGVPQDRPRFSGLPRRLKHAVLSLWIFLCQPRSVRRCHLLTRAAPFSMRRLQLEAHSRWR